jgi:hypothetical protein
MALVNTRNEEILQQLFVIVSRYELAERIVEVMGALSSDTGEKAAKAIHVLLERAGYEGITAEFLVELEQIGLPDVIQDIGIGVIQELDTLHADICRLTGE